LAARQRGWFLSYWGEAQYFILPKLPEAKISSESTQLIKVLSRKFESSMDEEFFDSSRIRGGQVISPLIEPNNLSDFAWSKLIASTSNESPNGRSVQYGEDTIIESSIEQFARSLDKVVRNEPIRFANLALTLPIDISEEYVRAFYLGLSAKDVQSVDEVYKERFQLCTPKLIESVIRHFGQSKCTTPLIMLLDSRYSENGEWSEETRDLIINIAKTAESPKLNKLSSVKLGTVNDASEASAHSLEGTAINSDRSIAYRRIGRLFWDNQELSIKLRHLIDDAIEDPHPAVNISAVNMLLPIFNYDRSFASEKFLDACAKDIRASTARGHHYFFNSEFEGTQQKKYADLVLAMLNSSFAEVRKQGAHQVFARWYFNDLFKEEVATLFEGEDAYREGISSVLGQFVRNGQYQNNHKKLTDSFERLVNDESKQVRLHLANAIRSASFWESPLSKELFHIYVNSQAALSDLWGLFNTIDKCVESLLEYQSELLALIENVIENVESDTNIRGSSLVNVLQRLYDQASADKNQDGINLCLDMWDKLLSSDVYSAARVTKQLDNGLLG
jgi:hypothetical protein